MLSTPPGDVKFDAGLQPFGREATRLRRVTMRTMPAPLDLQELVAETITEVQFAAEARGVHVTAVDLAAMPRWVEADDTTLRRLLHTLLDLAVNTASGGVVTVRVDRDDPAGDHWTMAVDWQGDENSTIDTLRCAFTAALPPATGLSAGRPLRVLVVDDSPQQRALMTAYLAGTPHQVEQAGAGAEAVARVREAGFDVILMDAGMPDLDGAGATRQIRAVEQAGNRPPAHIVALTSATESPGADSCLPKPLSRLALFKVLGSLPEPAVPVAAPGSPRSVDLASTRQDLLSALAAGQDTSISRLGDIGRDLREAAGQAGLQDIAHLSSALERAAAESPRAAVTAARTLLAWLGQAPLPETPTRPPSPR